MCLLLCNDDGIVDTSLPTFVAPMIPLVFANQPKTLVCNEGCHVMITTNTTTRNKPLEAWMRQRELSCMGYYNTSRHAKGDIRGTCVCKRSILNTMSVNFRLVSNHLCNTCCPLNLRCSGWCWAHNCVT
jgi:hypothetical protein